jgi:hypothetical protein
MRALPGLGIRRRKDSTEVVKKLRKGWTMPMSRFPASMAYC